MSEHARLSPSGAEGWTACAGKPNAEEGLPDTTNPAAEQGTAAHELLEIGTEVVKLTQNINTPTMSNGVTLNADDVAAVMVAERYFREQDYEYSASEIRSPINRALGRDDCWGTADKAGVLRSTTPGAKGHVMEVTDYKHGSGIVVEVHNNYQGLLYAMGCAMLPEFKHCTEVKITIIQPRAEHPDGPIRSWTLTLEELKQWAAWFLERAEATDDPNAPRTPGEKQCRWCKALAPPAETGRGPCKAAAEHSLTKSLAKFDGITFEVAPESLLRDPGGLTPEQVRTVLDNMKLITSWLSAVKDSAEKSAAAGVKILGYKRVLGRKSKSYVEMEGGVDAIEKKLRGMKKLDGKKISMKDILKTELISPSQALKTLKPLVSERTYQNINALVITNDGKPTLVPESDRRPEIPSKLESAFADIPAIAPTEEKSTVDLSFLS